MKSLMTMTMAAAAFVAAAGMASAQTLEAKIPFDFRTNGKVLAAGTYRVQVQQTASGNALLVFSNRRKNQQALAVAFPTGKLKADSGDAVLTFRCDANRCALSDIWMGTGAVYQLPKTKLSKADAERAEIIVMLPVTSE